nr:MAG TPA: hypothetical protein [Caudoviricetes sp.]
MSDGDFGLENNILIFCHNVVDTIFSILKLLSQALK